MVMRLAESGPRAVAGSDPGFGRGVNVTEGALIEPGVAEAHGLEATPLAEVWGVDPQA